MTHLTRMSLLGSVLGLAGLVAACSSAPQHKQPEKHSMEKFVFLTRQGCVNTVTMRENFDAALKTLALPSDYQFIDADTLASDDPRGGYGTPTILDDGRDLFDMPEPPVPHPPPT